LTVLQSLSRSILAALAARGGRQAAPLLGLRSLQHIPAARIHLPRAAPVAHYGPPSGFGYPLDGFLPLPPRRACFVPTALVGLIPSKHSPLARWLARFHARRTRMPLARRDLPLACQRTGAPNTDFQALALARVPCRPRGISPRLAGGSLGISPFQGIAASRLVRAYARNSPRVLCVRRR
jgi:hypothetical protein